ncbi:MAG TPA: site-2 protease family protein [Candidatus Thermoplasmatota archaeon]|nr:site-2 protease family protein [Candidatus Thermoplasmatota archaeon]
MAASNLTVGRVRGIPIRLHVTFLLVLPFFAYIMAEAYFDRGEGFPGPLALVWGGALAVTLFASVVLHELSHSLTAMRYGVRIKSITLLPIGGVSAMERMPSEPWQERRIALAGPVVNFAIGLPIVAVTRLELIPAIVPQFDTFVGWVGWLNVLLGAFNLFLPAFPMDGGRVLRATLAARMGYDRATGWATGIGRALAFVMGAFGFVMLLRGAGGGIWLLLIAFFIYLGANEEERMVGMTTRLGDLTVERIMTRQPETSRPRRRSTSSSTACLPPSICTSPSPRATGPWASWASPTSPASTGRRTRRPASGTSSSRPSRRCRPRRRPPTRSGSSPRARTT